MALVNLHPLKHRLTGSAPDIAAEVSEQLASAAERMHSPGWQRGLLTAACDVLEQSLQQPVWPSSMASHSNQCLLPLPTHAVSQSPIANNRS